MRMVEASHGSAVTSLSELEAADVAILTFVSLRERAWSLNCGERETDQSVLLRPARDCLRTPNQLHHALQDGETHISRRRHYASVRHIRYPAIMMRPTA